MLFNIGTVGFSKLENTETRINVINDVINNSTNSESIETIGEEKFVESRKQYGKNIGVIVRGIQNNNKMTVTNIVPYADSSKYMSIKEISIEKVQLEFSKEPPVVENEYHVTFTDSYTDIEMTFYLQNVVEYLKSLKENKKTFKGVKISALAYTGTIVLPLLDDEDEFEEISGEYDMFDGDDDEYDCISDEEALNRIITEGTLLEDMDQYFIQSQKLDTVYHILGPIKNVKKIVNVETKEMIYLIEIEVLNGVIDIYVNKKGLTGYPTPGMRFMGTCWLQGNILFENGERT